MRDWQLSLRYVRRAVGIRCGWMRTWGPLCHSDPNCHSPMGIDTHGTFVLVRHRPRIGSLAARAK